MGRIGLMTVTVAVVIAVVLGASVLAALLRHGSEARMGGSGHGHGPASTTAPSGPPAPATQDAARVPDVAAHDEVHKH